MRLIQFISVIFILFIVACNNNTSIENNTDKAKPVNALLPTDVTVSHLFPFHPQDEEWIKNFDYKKFLDDIIVSAGNDEINIFDFANTSYGIYTPMNKEEVSFVINGPIDTVYIEDPETGEFKTMVMPNPLRIEEVSQFFFSENWFLDAENFNLSKEVKSFGLVKEYYRADDINKEQKIKKILFELNFINDSTYDKKNKELLAENIKYEFALDNFEWVKNLNHEKFMNILLEKIDSGDVKAFDFYDNSQQLSIKDIKNNMGLLSDSLYVENPETFDLELKIIDYDITPDLFGSYIFIEDWYLDRTTFKIIKDVKGIAPVYFMYREDGELSKKIPFVVWF